MSISLPQPGAGTASPPKQIVDPGKTRRRGWMLSLLAGLLATIAGSAFFLYLNRYETEIGVKQSVVVAAKAIPARALITPDMLTTVELPVKYMPPSYLLNPQDLLDGNTTALINIAPGEYVQQNMISRNSGLEPGLRAVAVPVDPITSVGNSVRQGNYVDLLVSYTDPAGRPKTEVLLQNVKVLAVDTLLPAQGGTGGQTYLPAGIDGQVRLAPSTVATLELSLEDSVRLTHASNFAKELRLVIRRLDEQGTPNIAPAEFIGGGQASQGTPQNPNTVPAPDSQPESNTPTGGDSGR